MRYPKAMIWGLSSLLALACGCAASAEAPAASGAVSSEDAGLGDIIVTAQKRSQAINDVGMSINALSGDDLTRRGIVDTADLAKVVPGFVFTPNPFNVPIYTLRGIGFYESTLSATPTVTVYTDEIPVPFSAMTKAAGLDLERAEVLKGPQGTLFGNNATGGAINYIAAKPTDHFSAGGDVSVARFGLVDAQGFINGPVTDTLNARFAFRAIEGGAWQKSYTRDDKNGRSNQIEGRLLLDWHPTDRFKVLLNLNAWRDKSQPQAGQIYEIQAQVPGKVDPGILAYPLAPHNDRAADWNPTTASTDYPGDAIPSRNDRFYQAALRAQYELADGINLTSISAFERFKTRSAYDADATDIEALTYFLDGHVSSFNQELRLSGDTGRANWVIGGNYERDKVYERQLAYVPFQSNNEAIPGIVFHNSANFSRQNMKTYAVFGNVEYKLTDHLKAQAGIRYTEADRNFAACANSRGDPATAETFEVLQQILKGGDVIPIGPNDCFTLETRPGFPNQYDPTEVIAQLNQHNVSWRTGLNWEPSAGTLLYANVSKGYKSGSFPTNTAATTQQYVAATQESVLAYEVGFKTSLLQRAVQLNGALFYYDYKNKQVRGNLMDPVFGPLDALVNVPKSRVEGGELQLYVRPVHGLDINLQGTYIDSKIQRFTGYNRVGVIQDYSGTRFPYTPKVQTSSDVQYSWPVGERLSLFVGGSMTYTSSTNTALGYLPEFALPSYTLLDARAGVEAADQRWRVSIWSRNLTNKYYWVNAVKAGDALVRYTGRPVTFGLTLSTRLN
jgi:iron complex outermembrane recepter protein